MPGMMKKAAAPKPKITATPKPSPSTFAQRSKAAEAELKMLLQQKKVKDINKAKDNLMKKYGVRPNGRTN
jgi:hypothetical protein